MARETPSSFFFKGAGFTRSPAGNNEELAMKNVIDLTVNAEPGIFGSHLIFTINSHKNCFEPKKSVMVQKECREESKTFLGASIEISGSI